MPSILLLLFLGKGAILGWTLGGCLCFTSQGEQDFLREVNNVDAAELKLRFRLPGVGYFYVFYFQSDDNT